MGSSRQAGSGLCASPRRNGSPRCPMASLHRGSPGRSSAGAPPPGRPCRPGQRGGVALILQQILSASPHPDRLPRSERSSQLLLPYLASLPPVGRFDFPVIRESPRDAPEPGAPSTATAFPAATPGCLAAAPLPDSWCAETQSNSVLAQRRRAACSLQEGIEQIVPGAGSRQSSHYPAVPDILRQMLLILREPGKAPSGIFPPTACWPHISVPRPGRS